ncbi:trehalase-like domain-containing protein [Streptomyces sp. NPDC088789]|uniref:trehalase-like domain-containing protein n=1 Tax=Streptomyces sp. NPDC088789 TaxID=3365899 RepID=UPI00382CE913
MTTAAALISRNGTVGWWCPPRFDSDAVFTRLPGTEKHDHWSLAPTTGPDTGDTPPPPPGRHPESWRPDGTPPRAPCGSWT